MANQTTQWILELVDKMTKPLQDIASTSASASTKIDSIADATDKMSTNMQQASSKLKSFGEGMMLLNQTSEALGKMGEQMDGTLEPGIRFEYAMAEMQAITGQTGEVLDDLGERARKNAEIFGTDASNSVEVFKVLLSKLTPELAKSPVALDSMSNSVLTLSKAMNNDTAGAVDILTTAMNQYQVSTEDPIAASKAMSDMMNIMAASAREGSAEMPEIKSALEQAGMTAKMAGVSFHETISAIQVLDKAGKQGAEGGVALRNALTILGQGRFMPKDVLESLEKAGINVNGLGDKSKTLGERLQLLQPIMGDSALLSKLFGRENTAAGLALLSNIPLLDQYSTAIQGTTVANDQAAIIMGTQAEKMKKMNAEIDDLKLSLFDYIGTAAPAIKMTVAFATAATAAGVFIFSTKQIVSAFSLVLNSTFITSIKSAITGFYSWAASAVASGGIIRTAISSIPIIGWIAMIVTAIAGFTVYLYNTSEKFRGFIWGGLGFVKKALTEVGAFFKETLSGIWDLISLVFNPANWFDDSKSIDSALAKISNAAVKYGKAIAQGTLQGKKEGEADFRAEKGAESDKALKAQEGKKEEALTILLPPKSKPEQSKKNTSTVINTDKPTKGKKESDGISGGGNGGGARNLNMTINLQQHFHSVTGSNIEIKEIANKVMQEITGVLRDGIIALD